MILEKVYSEIRRPMGATFTNTLFLQSKKFEKMPEK